MQDNDERLGTRHPIKPAVMGFPADKVACRMQTVECDPFDLLGNAPYSNPPKSSPEKGEKSRREQQIFNCRKRCVFDDGSLENQWQLPKCLLDFESSTSRYSSYISLFCFALNRLFSALTLVFDILTYFVLYVACGCLGNI